jgi:hypothetical protein
MHCVLTACLISAAVPAAVAEPSSLDRARARLDEAFRAGQVEGHIVRTAGGSRPSYRFDPADGSLPAVPIRDPDKAVGPGAVGPTVRVRGTFDLDDLTLVVGEVAWAYAPEPSSNAVLPPLEAYANNVAAAMRTGQMSAFDLSAGSGSAFDLSRKESLRDLVDAYTAARRAGDRAKADKALVDFATLRTEQGRYDRQNKAIYDNYSNYAAWRYGQVVGDARAAVAIGEPGASTSLCSGVLVGTDGGGQRGLVMTAGHCFARWSPEELEIWFDYAQFRDEGGRVQDRPKQVRRITRLVVPVEAKRGSLADQRFGEGLYDYAVVEFEPPAGGGPLVPNEAAAACLRTRPLARDEGVYVIGFPKGLQATVHDDARVYLPYRVRGQFDLDELRAEIDADYRESGGRDRVAAEFEASYVRQPGGGVPLFLFQPIGESKQPRMGIVADTFEGDSGAPVYDHTRDQCVVGIFVAGAPDSGRRLTPSWDLHESVLPMTAIVEDLKSQEETRKLVEPEGPLKIIDPF